LDRILGIHAGLLNPASILNQNKAGFGTPFDSIRVELALVDRD